MSKLSNLMKLKGDWHVEEYDINKGWIQCYNSKWNLMKKVAIPPLFLKIIEWEKLNGIEDTTRKIRNLLGC